MLVKDFSAYNTKTKIHNEKYNNISLLSSEKLKVKNKKYSKNI